MKPNSQWIILLIVFSFPVLAGSIWFGAEALGAATIQWPLLLIGLPFLVVGNIVIILRAKWFIPSLTGYMSILTLYLTVWNLVIIAMGYLLILAYSASHFTLDWSNLQF